MLSKLLVGVSVVGAGVVIGALAGRVIERRRASPVVAPGPRGTGRAAGTMSVGSVDEVELGAGLAGPMRGGEPEMFDPEEVPSEHSEVNDLRRKMPFG